MDAILDIRARDSNDALDAYSQAVVRAAEALSPAG
jgi:hypothetical protein